MHPDIAKHLDSIISLYTSEKKQKHLLAGKDLYFTQTGWPQRRR